MPAEIMVKKGLEEAEKAKKKAELQKELMKKEKELKFAERLSKNNPTERDLLNVKFRARDVENAAKDLQRFR